MPRRMDASSQRNLREPGRSLEQEVARAGHLAFRLLERVRDAPEQADEQLSDQIVLADDDLADLLLDPVDHLPRPLLGEFFDRRLQRLPYFL